MDTTLSAQLKDISALFSDLEPLLGEASKYWATYGPALFFYFKAGAFLVLALGILISAGYFLFGGS